jgi:anti-sigma B factor antagonist
VSPGTDLVIIAGQRGDWPVLRLRGELDVSSRDQLRRAISAALEHYPKVLVLDASGLDFIDCGGLSVLIWAHQRMAERGHQLIITGATPMVRRLLHVTGLDIHLYLSSPDPDLSSPDPDPGAPGLDLSTAESISPQPPRSGPRGTTVIPGPVAGAAGSTHADLESR